ncbi:hypothetical protein MBLNU13_g03873t2 [Cladosporium sp. NU13]
MVCNERSGQPSRQTTRDIYVGKKVELVLLLTQKAYGLPAPAAYEKQWEFWSDQATLGLNSTYYRDSVPPALKAQAMDDFLAVALGQTDVDVGHQIVARIIERNDPYTNCFSTTLHEHAEVLQSRPQSSRNEAQRKRQRLEESPDPLGNMRGRAKHRTVA